MGVACHVVEARRVLTCMVKNGDVAIDNGRFTLRHAAAAIGRARLGIFETQEWEGKCGTCVPIAPVEESVRIALQRDGCSARRGTSVLLFEDVCSRLALWTLQGFSSRRSG